METRPWHKAYEAGVPTALDLEALTVSQFLERAATDHGDATAIIYFNRRLTYRQLKNHVDRFAAALAQLGVTRDSRVARDAELRQGGRESVDVVLELPIGEAAIEVDDGRRVTVIRCGALQELRDRQRLEVERRRHPRLVGF